MPFARPGTVASHRIPQSEPGNLGVAESDAAGFTQSAAGNYPALAQSDFDNLSTYFEFPVDGYGQVGADIVWVHFVQIPSFLLTRPAHLWVVLVVEVSQFLFRHQEAACEFVGLLFQHRGVDSPLYVLRPFLHTLWFVLCVSSENVPVKHHMPQFVSDAETHAELHAGIHEIVQVDVQGFEVSRDTRLNPYIVPKVGGRDNINACLLHNQLNIHGNRAVRPVL